jgi:hypothetical protein
MNSALNGDLVNTLVEDRVRAAEQQRRARQASEKRAAGDYTCVMVRVAGADDRAAIERLEQLEGRRLPPEPTLLAEAGGHVLVARSLLTRELVADPWQPTAELVELLDLRSLHLRGQLDRRHRARRLGVRRLLRTLAPTRS